MDEIKQSVEVASACESCNAKDVELFDVPHHQEGNNKIWKYCSRCKDLHLKELTVNKNLKELLNTHPDGANTPAIAAMFHEGKSVDEVKKFLDTNKQPELEAEVA
jgi:hypothetical protein